MSSPASKQDKPNKPVAKRVSCSSNKKVIKENDVWQSTSRTIVEPYAQKRLRQLTDNFRFCLLYPKPTDLPESLKRLRADLLEVPVMASDGTLTDLYSKIEAQTILTRQDKEIIWNCLSMVRDAFIKIDTTERAQHKDSSYQWNMNWKHIRAEVDQVLEAAKLLKLSGEEMRDAMLASIFSDAMKNRSNFIIRNVHGAQCAALAVSYFLNPHNLSNLKSLERIAQAIKEHQVAPPEFMAKAVVVLICQKLKLALFEQDFLQQEMETDFVMRESSYGRIIGSIYKKIRDPFNKKHLNKDLTMIKFTSRERALLHEIGVEEWYVPHPENPESKIAHAVIAGDHSINYNHPEGFAKIALIRGPDTEAIFEDPTVHHSLQSAVCSFTDSFRVIRPEVQPLAMAGLRRTKAAVQRVTAIMSELFSGVTIGPRSIRSKSSGIEMIRAALDRVHERHAELFATAHCVLSEAGAKYAQKTIDRVGGILQDWCEVYGDIPFSPKNGTCPEPGPAKLPFWNAPLKYPPRGDNGQLALDELSSLELKQFLFANKIREIAVELLRAEQWIF